jgi:cytochrome oxidase assembly protein ShyY1
MTRRTKALIITYAYLALFIITLAFATWAIGRAYDHTLDTYYTPAQARPHTAVESAD